MQGGLWVARTGVGAGWFPAVDMKNLRRVLALSEVLSHWGGRNRTSNHRINSAALCRLSYTPSLPTSIGTTPPPREGISPTRTRSRPSPT